MGDPAVLRNSPQSFRKQGKQLRNIAERTGSELKFIIPPSPCDIQWDLPADISAHVVNGNEWPLAKVDTMYYDDVHLRGSAANAYSAWLAQRLSPGLN